MTDTTFRRIYEESETFYVPQYEVRINGRSLPDNIVRDVMQVTYKDNVQEIDSFDLQISNYDSLRGLPKYEPPSAPEHGGIFDPGKRIELWIGYVNNLRLMLSGEITTLEPSFPATGPLTLSVRGLNVLHRLRTEQHTKSWSEKTDSQIATELGNAPVRQGRPGLGVPVRADNAGEPQETFVFMHNQYDIVFLMERARRRGYEIVWHEADATTGQTEHLTFGPSETRANVPNYHLEWGKTLISFRPTLSTAQQIGEVVVMGWDRRTRQRIEERATWQDLYPRNSPERARMQLLAQAFQNRREIVTDRPVHTRQEARRLARDILRDVHKTMVEASGETVGLPDLRAGRKVKISGLGSRFDGVYYVTETTHSLGDGGYKTTFKGRREEGLAS